MALIGPRGLPENNDTPCPLWYLLAPALPAHARRAGRHRLRGGPVAVRRAARAALPGGLLRARAGPLARALARPGRPRADRRGTGVPDRGPAGNARARGTVGRGARTRWRRSTRTARAWPSSARASEPRVRRRRTRSNSAGTAERVHEPEPGALDLSLAHAAEEWSPIPRSSARRRADGVPARLQAAGTLTGMSPPYVVAALGARHPRPSRQSPEVLRVDELGHREAVVGTRRGRARRAGPRSPPARRPPLPPHVARKPGSRSSSNNFVSSPCVTAARRPRMTASRSGVARPQLDRGRHDRRRPVSR